MYRSTYPVPPVARVVTVRLAVEVVHDVPAQRRGVRTVRVEGVQEEGRAMGGRV
jgi:hypothetical protein